jgi:2-(1,2-epoxy-1,2-dihydrophenyl)acetyl-CoA isomerase
MEFRNLRYELEGGVARITLCRPDGTNAIDLALARELLAAALLCDEDPAVRAVLLRAEGKMFCAGGDLGAFRAAGDAVPSLLKELTIPLHAAVSRLARMRAPSVAAVGGAAAGAGFSLLCGIDFVIASEKVKLTLAYTQVGLAPDGSSTWWLPRLVGPRRAAELMMTNRVLTAQEALDLGLVTRVVPPERVEAEALELAKQLAAGPTEAYGHVKRLLLSSAGESLETQMELEARAIADAARTADAREGMAAFFEKRNPTFKGR